MRSDVISQPLHHELVHYPRLLVRRRFLEPPVEFERVTAGAVLFVTNGFRAWRAMTVDALQLDRSVRTAQIGLEVHSVIQFHRARIDAAGPQDREFRMCLIE